MPLAVYIAQNRRGICPVTSAPMASRTGSASATPPIPFQESAAVDLKGCRSHGNLFEFYYFSRNNLLLTT